MLLLETRLMWMFPFSSIRTLAPSPMCRFASSVRLSRIGLSKPFSPILEITQENHFSYFSLLFLGISAPTDFCVNGTHESWASSSILFFFFYLYTYTSLYGCLLDVTQQMLYTPLTLYFFFGWKPSVPHLLPCEEKTIFSTRENRSP